MALGVSFFIFGGIGVYVYLLTTNKITIGYNKGYEPTQPIPFSHALHAGTYKIDCRYCHVGVEVSRHATIPSLNICMNCHLSVGTASPHIQKLAEAYNEGRSIAWQKVHLLPDHVKFNHMAHIKKGKQCVECHGAVEKMDVVKDTQGLTMGACISCHRKPENQAPVDCTTCHY